MSQLRLLLDRILQAICVLLMVGLAVMVLTAVFLRTIGKSPLWYDEVAAIWLVWLTFFGASLVTLRRAHLGFDALTSNMSPTPRRACFFVSEIAILSFYGITAIYGWLVLDIIAGETLISLPWLGYEVVQSVIPITATVMFVAQLLSSSESWKRLHQ